MEKERERVKMQCDEEIETIVKMVNEKSLQDRAVLLKRHEK